MNFNLKRDKVHITKHSLKLIIAFLVVFDNMNLTKQTKVIVMYQHLTDQVESIQLKAMQDMEKVFQKEFDSVFNDLCKLYPKRHIYIIFGNGALCVKGFENLCTHMGLADSYGSLVNYSELQPHIKQKFPSDHPLIKLMQLMDICYYPSSCHGWTMALEDLKADPVESKLK